MAGISLGAITGALSSVGGLTGTALTSTASAIAGLFGSTNSQIKTICTTIIANVNDQAVVQDAITKLAEVPNLPGSVVALLPVLRKAQTPTDIFSTVMAIENTLGHGIFG